MNRKNGRIVRSNEKRYPTTPTTPNTQQAGSVPTSKASEASILRIPNVEVDNLQTPVKQKPFDSYEDVRLKRRRMGNGDLDGFGNRLNPSGQSTSKLLMDRSFGNTRRARMANQRLNVVGEALVLQTKRATLRHVQLPPTVSCTIAMTMPRDEDDLIFATHGGDHTLTVSSHSTGKVVQRLMGHSRTPWSVAVHPADNSIVASGCLSGNVCLWRNYKLVETITVGSDIVMSLAFKLSRRRTFDSVDDDDDDLKGRRDGYKMTSRSVNRNEIEQDHDELYIACGNFVYVWCYGLSSINQALQNTIRIQCLCLTSPFSWGSLLTGSLDNHSGTATISLWTPEDLSHNGDQQQQQQIIPKKVLGNVILYSEGGLCVSQCGGYLCAAVKSSMSSNGENTDYTPRDDPHTEIVVVSLQSCSFGQVLRSMKLRGILGKGMTSVKFSPTDEHIVCGYGVSERPVVSSRSNEKLCWTVYGNYGDRNCFVNVQSLDSREDDINVAIFHPVVGNGILYGTRQGPLRLLGS